MTEHPRLPGRIVETEILTDEAAAWPVASTEVVYDSDYLSVTVDTVADPGGAEHLRAVVRPHGAVGVVALDEDDRLLLIAQYRHPVGRRLLEIPAGTLDVVGEPPLVAAARELAEEADVTAATWSHELTLFASPGYSSEQWDLYVATDLSPVPLDDRTERHAEEADMAHWWMPFADAVAAVLDGRITDSMAVAAILGVHARRT
ncbi:NUDIX domain-containing protein [Aeromicrobium sp. CF3.5]|uniref:NUDIX domain-containing protein n=1 Tax=Aeromicrobium sp. CF3.5 TaxID=3373078 RepID=UPI003EE7FEA7